MHFSLETIGFSHQRHGILRNDQDFVFYHAIGYVRTLHIMSNNLIRVFCFFKIQEKRGIEEKVLALEYPETS